MGLTQTEFSEPQPWHVPVADAHKPSSPRHRRLCGQEAGKQLEYQFHFQSLLLRRDAPSHGELIQHRRPTFIGTGQGVR